MKPSTCPMLVHDRACGGCGWTVAGESAESPGTFLSLGDIGLLDESSRKPATQVDMEMDRPGKTGTDLASKQQVGLSVTEQSRCLWFCLLATRQFVYTKGLSSGDLL